MGRDRHPERRAEPDRKPDRKEDDRKRDNDRNNDNDKTKESLAMGIYALDLWFYSENEFPFDNVIRLVVV